MPSASGNGIGASPGPEFGTSESIATVVSLPRKRSCRYAARSAHSSRFGAPQSGTIPSTRLHGLGRVLRPRSVGHDVMRVHVEDELGAGQRLLARHDFVRRRHRERAARTGGRRSTESRRGRRRRPRGRRAARGEIDRGEHGRDAGRALQEPAPIHAGPIGRVVDGRPGGRLHVAFVPARRIGDVLAVGSRRHGEREFVVVVGVVGSSPHVHSLTLRRAIRFPAKRVDV